VIDQIEDDQQSKQMLRTIIDDELATMKEERYGECATNDDGHRSGADRAL